MKNKKWLLIIVIVVFVLNIGFWALTKIAKVDQIIQKRASQYLSKTLNSEVEIGFFTFSDTQANISDLTIRNNDQIYDLHIGQIYVEYNLPQLLFSKFKNLKSIKKITILDPEVQLNISPKFGSSENFEFTIPKIEEFFGEFVMKNGSLKFNFDTKYFKVDQQFEKINLQLVNDKASKIKLNTLSNGSIISGNALLDDGKIIESNLYLDKQLINSMQIFKLDTLSFKATGHVKYNDLDGLTYKGELSEALVTTFDRTIISDLVNFSGSLDKTFIGSDLLVDGNKSKVYIILSNLLQKDRSISANAEIPEIEIKQYLPMISGQLSAKAVVSGSLERPEISIIAESDSLQALDQIVKNIDAKADIGFEQINFDLLNLDWEDNLIIGDGFYNYKTGLNANITIDNFIYEAFDSSVNGDFAVELSYDKMMKANLLGSQVKFQYKDLIFDDFALDADLKDDKFNLSLNRPVKDLAFEFSGDTKIDSLNLLLSMKRFDLNKLFQQYDLPVLSGNMNIKKTDQLINLISTLRYSDQAFGKLDGRIVASSNVNLDTKAMQIACKTYSTKFNYEPFKLDFSASGSYDNLRTDRFEINDKIFVDGWYTNMDSLDYGLNISAKDVKINEYLKYFMHSYLANQVKGKIDLDLNYDTREESSIIGKIDLKQFGYAEMKKMDSNISLIGNLEQIELQKFNISQDDISFFTIDGSLSIFPEFRVDLDGSLKQFDLSRLLPESPLQGDLSANISYHKDSENSAIKLNLNSKDLILSKQRIGTLELIAAQHDTLFVIDKLLVNSEDNFELSGSGNLNYNFITNEAYPNSDSLNLKFSGDLLGILAEEIEMISSAKSKTNIDLIIGIEDSGLAIHSGNINLNKAELILANQYKPIEKVNIELEFSDNTLDIKDFKFRLGDGKIYIDNEISVDDDNFMLGTVNLGKFKVKTNSSGVLIHAPGFMPKNSIAQVNISGRYEPELLISGPFEDINVYGNISISNGEAIFPPDTENLLSLFGKVRTDSWFDKDQVTIEEDIILDEDQELPFSLDLVINFDENIRYVTYPANLKIDPDSFLHISYKDSEFKITEALFICYDGSADLFGTQMTTDYLKIQLNEFQQGIEIVGNFYKRASDGTVITFEIYDDSSNFESTNLQFQLISDNPNDGVLDILSLLRYGRRVDDIGDGQKKTLLQDEVVNIIGIGLESAILDPLISPVENWIRSKLNLDFFYLSTDLVQNVFSSFTNSDDQQYVLTSESNEDIETLNYDDFLNNMSLNAGKYLSRKLFLDYEAKIEKSYNLDYTTKLGVYQYYSLRYDMPYNFRLIYQFQVKPFDNDTNQITLQKSFRF